MAGLMSDKKKALLAYKEEVLRDIKYFENRIKVTQSQKNDSSYFDDDDSDSDNDFTLNTGPSISQLKLEQGMLQTCLHATQELTSLYVLQSEINVMVEDPVLEREPPVMEEGMWREVTAECRVDLVPFSITFFTHKPTRLYGPVSYRGLRVLPVKAAHENELQKSILPQLGTPSDAVEVLRSYAVAYRSRRTTLARLAEKYPNNLFMEPMADGGYIIKCADLLEVSWILENKWSPVAAFHHRMKFDLEYMEEAYVKIISQVHKELSDPSLTTDERTRLMAKIIATCLEARGPRYESMESDLESENPKSVFNEEIEQLQKKDSEVMAPPKSLPKRIKPKGKENTIDNRKPTKRTATDDKIDSKKAKLNKDGRNSVASASKDSVAIVNKENNGINQVSDNIVQKDTNKGSKSKAKEIGASSKKSNDVGDLRKSNKISNNVKESDNNPKKSDTVNKNTNIKNVNAKNTNTKNTKRVENNEDDLNNPKLTKGHNINEGTSENTEISNTKKNKENVSQKDMKKNAKGAYKNNTKSANTEKDNKVISNNNKDSIPKKSVTKVNCKDVASVNGIANKNDEVVAKNSVAKTKSDKVRNVASTNDKNTEIIAKKSVKAKSSDNVNVASTNTIINNNDVPTKSVGKSAGSLKSVANVNTNNKNDEVVSKKSIAKPKSAANVNNVANVNTISNKNDVPSNSVATKSSNINYINTDSNINDNAKKNVKEKEKEK
ncbi:uncharacterized protein [Epargyreus clarus]|uniref:uncharacterized protein isoform X2 n=1 Tax=Epargyreus clarus TaxID=520877 RepID=UPI003C2EC94A